MVTKVQKIEAPSATPGGVESLADIANEAAFMQAGEQSESDRARQAQQQANAGQQQAQQHAQMASMSQEVVQVLVMVRGIAADLADAAGALPKATTMGIWSDDRIAGLAGPLALVLERGGDQLSAFMERYGPYMALIAAGAMPAIATVKAVREHKAINVQARVVRDEQPEGEGA